MFALVVLKTIIIVGAVAATWYGITYLYQRASTKLLIDAHRAMSQRPMVVDGRLN